MKLNMFTNYKLQAYEKYKITDCNPFVYFFSR